MNMENEEKIEHESFAQITFSRVQGRARFYGSELEQNHFISMEIKPSYIRRSLGSEWYFANNIPVVSLRMTSGQFAELITSMNYGQGACCTLEYVQGKKIADLPEIESNKEFTHRKFEERMTGFADLIREKKDKAKEIVKKKTLSKQDIHDLSMHLDWLTGEIERSIPFYVKQFQEATDKVVLEGKTEIENAILHKINTAGLSALHEQNKLLDK